MGYFGYAYYVENKDKLKAVPIVNDKGQAGTLSSSEAVKSPREDFDLPTTASVK